MLITLNYFSLENRSQTGNESCLLLANIDQTDSTKQEVETESKLGQEDPAKEQRKPKNGEPRDTEQTDPHQDPRTSHTHKRLSAEMLVKDPRPVHARPSQEEPAATQLEQPDEPSLSQNLQELKLAAETHDQPKPKWYQSRHSKSKIRISSLINDLQDVAWPIQMSLSLPTEDVQLLSGPAMRVSRLHHTN